MSHSHTGGNPDPHIITQGEDVYILRAVYYDTAQTNMPDLSTYTATYAVFAGGDTSTLPVIALGTTAGMTVSYNDGASTTPTTAGITLGLNGADEVATTLSGAAVEGASTVTVTSATGLAIDDWFTVVLDDGSIHVTTIAGLASTTVTLTTALGGPAASGNVVKAFNPDYALHNIEIWLTSSTTRNLADWGVGQYQIDLIDTFSHAQRVMTGTCCLDGGHGHG